MLASQISRLRDRGTAQVETAFPTTIAIGAHTGLPAARWSATAGAGSELAGLLATYDVTFRVRRTVLAGITLAVERTLIVEDGKTYRLAKIHDAKNDPALLLACQAV